MLISYAVGALLGAVFLEILPHAFSTAPSIASASRPPSCSASCCFFVLEKLVLWRHCHRRNAKRTTRTKPASNHDHGRSGMMIMIGDTFHNFVDGVLIAAAFLADVAARAWSPRSPSSPTKYRRKSATS